MAIVLASTPVLYSATTITATTRRRRSRNRGATFSLCSSGWSPARGSSYGMLGIVATTTATSRRSRHRRTTFNLCFSGSPARGSSCGMVGTEQQFRLRDSSSSTSTSPRPLRVPRLVRHCCTVPSALSSSMNAREPLSGSILAELDRAAAKKQYQATVNASHQFHPAEPTPEHPLWNVLQQPAVCVLAAIIACSFLPKAAHAVAENSIGASSLGIKVAELLRRSGLPDELVVLTVATIPVLELRGAIPISYWLKLDPVKGYMLAVIGNMIPVPFIVLYVEKTLKYVGESSEIGQKFVRWVFERTRRKAGPIEEFKWLGLMLFVAVPLPGTGAWTGAIAASILGMPFWDAMTANFLGVVLAGLLVNLFVSVGANAAFLVGIGILASSIFMWSVLRVIQQKKHT